MEKINIAIDGYSACGKSTTAKLVAQRLNYTYVDTGAMYRGITAYVLQNNIPEEQITKDFFKNIKLEYYYENGTPKIIINGKDYTEFLRLPEVSRKVSDISAIPAVREYLVPLQQEMAKQKGVVIDGRDIGSVVMPDAELKVFMTADINTRAERRYKELKEKGLEITLDEVKQILLEKDKKDTQRKISPLIKVPDARVLDTTNLTIDEQVNKIIEWTNEIVNARKSHSS